MKQTVLKEGVVNLKILLGGKEDDEWEYRGEFSYNSDDYSTGHPLPTLPGGTDNLSLKYIKVKTTLFKRDRSDPRWL